MYKLFNLEAVIKGPIKDVLAMNEYWLGLKKKMSTSMRETHLKSMDKYEICCTFHSVALLQT